MRPRFYITTTCTLSQSSQRPWNVDNLPDVVDREDDVVIPGQAQTNTLNERRKTRRRPITGSTMKMLFKTTQVE